MQISDVIVKRYIDTQRPDMKHAEGQEVVTVEVQTDADVTGMGFVSLPVFYSWSDGGYFCYYIKA